jgi:hypothetical protein
MVPLLGAPAQIAVDHRTPSALEQIDETELKLDQSEA